MNNQLNNTINNEISNNESITFSNNNNVNEEINVDNPTIIDIDEEQSLEDEDENLEEESISPPTNRMRQVVFENLSNQSKKIIENNHKPTFVVEKLPSMDDMNENTSISSNESSEGENDENIELNLSSEEGDENELFETILVEKEVAVPESQRLFSNDLMYLKEIENQLLSELPVSKQSLYYVQKAVELLAKQFVDLKNKGLERQKQIEKGMEYSYENSWVVPIVFDKHRIFKKVAEDDVPIESDMVVSSQNRDNNNNNNNDEYESDGFVDTREDMNGVEVTSQKEQMLKIKKIQKEANLNHIHFMNYLVQTENETKPYLIQEETILDPSQTIPKKIGYLLKNKHMDRNVLRLFDLDSIFWNNYQILSQFESTNNIRDNDGHITGLHSFTLIPSENCNIVGFMVLPKAGQDIVPEDVFTPTNYSSHLLSKYYKYVGDIENIELFNDGMSVNLTINNHHVSVESGSVLIIDDCEWSNRLNGIHKHIHIENENTIQIQMKKSKKIPNIPRKENAFKGKCYVLSPFAYDLYEIKWNGQSYIKEFIKTTYPDGEESEQHMKVFLFQKLHITTENGYQSILQLVSPTLTEIINMEYEKLKQVENIEDVEDILKPYGISYSMLQDEQFEIIRDIFDENVKRSEIQTENENKTPLEKIIYHSIHKNILSSPHLFLADMYIQSPFIQKYYGKYSHIGKPEDCLLNRLHWILSQLDNGIIYMNYVLFENIEQFENSHSIRFIQNQIQQSEEIKSELEKELKKAIDSLPPSTPCKLYHFDVLYLPPQSKISKFDDTSYTVKLGNDLIYYLNPGTIFYHDEKIQQVNEHGHIIEIEGKQRGIMALVGNEIYTWEGPQKKWERSEIHPKYHQIKYLCEFQDKNINEIDLDTLDCIYREKTGCDTREIGNIKHKIEFLEEKKTQFEKLKQYVENQELKNQIEQNIQKAIFRYFSKDITSVENEVKKNKKFQNEMLQKQQTQNVEQNQQEQEQEMVLLEEDREINHTPSEFIHLVSSIQKLKNNDLKTNLIFELIERDGLLIGKDIYSKKFRCKMNVCGHLHYFHRISKSPNIETKTELLKTLFDIYGDGGEVNARDITCTHCGTALDLVEYDIVEGYSSSGAFIINREVLEEVEEIHTDKSKSAYIDTCESVDLKKELYKTDFMKKRIPELMELCDILISNLIQKTGIKITVHEFIDILFDVIPYMSRIHTYESFLTAKKKILEEQGLSRSQIERLEMKNSGQFFKFQYEKYQREEKYSICSARLLIYVQTVLPNYIQESRKSICPFTSFYGDDGFQYFSCILNEIITSSEQTSESKEQRIMDLKKNIMKRFELFRKQENIRSLYRNKNEYLIELQKKKKLFLNGNEAVEIHKETYPEISPLSENFFIETSKETKMNIFYEMMSKCLKRMYYISQEIKHTLKDVIQFETKRTTDKMTPLFEKDCCLENLDDYVDYYTSIESIQTLFNQSNQTQNVPIQEYIQEAKTLEKDWYQLIIYSGSVSRLLLRGEDMTHFVFNPILVCNPETVSQSIIQDEFEIFESEGRYKGSLREYIGDGNEAKDVKSGKTRKQIRDKEYTREEFIDLLNSISKLHTHIPIEPDIQQEQERKSRLQDLKNKANSNMGTITHQFIENLSWVLHKRGDQTFIQKYIHIIENLGNFGHLFTNEHLQILEHVYEQNQNERYHLPLRDGIYKFDSKDDIEKRIQRLKIMDEDMKDSYRLEYIKKVINQYFRKNLSMIQHRYQIIKEDFTFTTPEISDELLQQIEIENDLFKEFMSESVSDFFKDIHFDSLFNSHEVDSIFGMNNQYNYIQYYQTKNMNIKDAVKVYSDLSFNDASRILIYLLLNQLNSFILCSKSKTSSQMNENEEAKEEKIDTMETSKIVDVDSRKCQTICRFIDKCFSLIEHDIQMFESVFKIEQHKQDIIHDILQKKTKQLLDEELDEDNYFVRIYTQNQLKTQSGKKINDFDSQVEEEQEEVENQMNENDKNEMYREQVIQQLMKNGEEINDKIVSERVQRLVEEKELDDIEDENENKLNFGMNEEEMDFDLVDERIDALGDDNEYDE